VLFIHNIHITVFNIFLFLYYILRVIYNIFNMCAQLYLANNLDYVIERFRKPQCIAMLPKNIISGFYSISLGVMNAFCQKTGYTFIWLFLCLNLLTNTHLVAQTTNLRIVGEMNCEDSSYCAFIQIKAQDAQHFRIGTSSIALTYDTQVINFLSYTSLSFDGSDLCYDQGNGSAWHPQNHIENSGSIYITLTLKPDSSSYSCPEVTDQEWIDIGTLCFDILDINGDPNIQFDLSTTPTGNPFTFFNSHLPNNGTKPITIGTTTGLSGNIFDCSSSIIFADIDLQARNIDTGRVSVHLYDPLNYTAPLYEYLLFTDEQGNFTLTDILPGSYDICIKHHKSLQRVQRVNIGVGENNVVFNELRMGDATNDNQIDIIDFAVLLSSYNKNASQDGYKDEADFNGDQGVNIIDFSVMLSNYNQTGENPGDSPERLTQSQKLNISRSAILHAIQLYPDSQEDTFRVLLQLESGKQAVDGVEAFLSFDPELSEVVEARISNKFDVTLLEEYDNRLGHINMAAGFMDSPAHGTLEVGEIVFVRKKPGNMLLTFDQSTLRNTNITFRGESVLNKAVIKLPDHTSFLNSDPLVIYPNPSNGIINILPPSLSYPASLKIFDINGKVIEDRIIASTKQLTDNFILISNKGIYNLYINDNKNYYNNFFIVK